MGRWIAVLLLTWASLGAAQAIRVRAPLYKTASTSFVEVPGTRLTAAPATTEFALLLWHATVSSEVGGPSTSELLIEAMDGGGRWGFFEGGHVAPLSGQTFRNVDWTAGMPVDLVARVRSTVPDASVTITNFEALFLPLGSITQVPFAERFDTIAVDGGWSALMTLQAGSARTGDWLLIAQANVATPRDAGVLVRVRELSVPPLILPAELNASPTGGALFSLSGTRPFFMVQQLSSMPLGTTLSFEARTVGSGGVASIRDARMVMIDLLQLEQEASSTQVTSVTPSLGTPLVLATAPMGPDRYLLSVVSGLAASDAGFTASWRFGPRSAFYEWPSNFDVEHPVISDWFFESTGTAAAGLILRTPASGFGYAAPFGVSIWRWDGGVTELGSFSTDAGGPDAGGPSGPDAGVPDAGVPDAGVPDAGVPDAGVPDAGVPDAGVPDAGVPDAGVPDAGGPDAGVPDAGVPDAGVPDAGVPDAGVPDAGVPDAGVPDAGSLDAGLAERVELTVGCGCGSTETAPLLLMLLVFFRRRARHL